MTTEQNCDEFEPLVSALIDDELSGAELSRVEAHLLNCSACRELVDEFRMVNNSVALLGDPGNESPSTAVETFVVTRQRPSMKSWMSVWRLAPIGAVAALLIGLFLVTTQSPPAATAAQLTPEQFVKPMADLNRINLHQQRDQELMLRTLGMDLRTLKLELNQLENAGPEDRERLEIQIETMLKRVEAFEKNH